jgi:tetratricopeptide (TPR) repeat protein
MSCRFTIFAEVVLAVALLSTASGCTEVRGRKHIQEANELYKRGRYKEAVAQYEAAEALVPNLPTLWLNKGYTCRQLIAPGGKDPQSQKAAACAIAAFAKLHALAPDDPRADQLTIQTWFDIDDFAALETTFLARNKAKPDDVDVVRALQEIYYKSGKWQLALTWSYRAAALRPTDAETQYGVGTFVWQLLSSRGGSAEMGAFDPWARERPETRATAPTMPVNALNDITGEKRIELADQGLSYLSRALTLRPRYPEAMTYASLLWRQKSFALFADPIAWQGAVDQADEWQRKALAARGGKT